MIYEEVLVLPDGGLLRSFAPPALIHTNKRFRDEAIPIFYGANLFEITIKRSLADELLAAGRKLPSVDLWVWRRFLHMWDVFNGSGTDGLRYVNHVTLIYQLSMDNGFPFGEDGFDKRLGFRFRSHRYEEDLDTNYEEDSDGESDSDSSNNDDLEMDFAKLEAEAADLEADMDNHEGQDLDEEDNSQDESVGGVDQVPEENAGQERGFELNRGTFDWPNRRETHFFFFHRIREFGNVFYRIKGSLEGVRHRLSEDGDLHPMPSARSDEIGSEGSQLLIRVLYRNRYLVGHLPDPQIDRHVVALCEGLSSGVGERGLSLRGCPVLDGLCVALYSV